MMMLGMLVGHARGGALPALISGFRRSPSVG